MFGDRLIKSNSAGAACTTDTVQILGDTSCVAYYKMNDATDETGSYDGTATNVNFNVAGKFGNAGEFNGSSSKITNTNQVIPNGATSFSFWYNPSGATSVQYIIGSGVATASKGISVAYTGSTGTFGVVILKGVTALAANFSGTTAYSNTDWHNVSVIWDGTTTSNAVKIYVNGSLEAEGTSNTSSASIGAYTTFGIGGVNGGGYAKGKIDQVRIFDRAITANEVTTLYNEVQCIPTIVPTDHFNTALYTGDDTNTSYTRDITGVGFDPDFVWIKDRDNGNFEHAIFDSVRGAGSSKVLSSDTTGAEGWTSAAPMSAFITDGFSVQPRSPWNANNLVNKNGEDFVAWNWKAGGDDVLNEEGTIDSQVSANVDAGFSVVKWNSSSNLYGSVGHGLSATPELIIMKRYSTTGDWLVWTPNLGDGTFLRLNTTGALATWGNGTLTPITSTTFTNADGGSEDYIAYAFHSVEGYSKIGSYVGTGTVGNSIVTGFRPAFMLFRAVDIAFPWELVDNKRPDGELNANNSDFERIENTPDFLQNGFRLTTDRYNNAGQKFIFMAIAEENVQPEPELANSFNVVTYTGNGGTQAVTGLGFEPDLVWIKGRSTSSQDHTIVDSVRGISRRIRPSYTSAEVLESGFNVTAFNSDGFTLVDNTAGNYNVNGAVGGLYSGAAQYVAWCWKASNDSTINQEGSITSIVSANPAAGFSVVSYNSNGTAGATVGTGLDSAAEMIIVKNRDDSDKWAVYHSATGATKFLSLNETSAATTSSAYWNNTEPTENSFTIGATSPVNSPNNEDYIAYCFHSTDNQKIGSYTMNGSALTVDVGFAPRFFLYKEATRAASWVIADDLRSAGGNYKARLYPDLSAVESTSQQVQFVGNTVVLNYGSTGNNATSGTGIYLAIA